MHQKTLHDADMRVAVLAAEWLVTIDTPSGGVDSVLKGLEEDLCFVQGPYDCCSYTNGGGMQRFRCLEGSHAGNEESIQQTAASQIVVSIPQEIALLQRLFDSVFKHHVNEEPTIRVQEAFGSRSKLLDDKENPNRYWNRADMNTLHGHAVEVPHESS
ncbi:hypothetical protein AB833_19210 [Chromatiales bacterium (ex Bugula neritina AB1)]|nr:hypothetical protein AB833_19210 [Chromatiales bacterium (ex Bugula neritina AB1)]